RRESAQRRRRRGAVGSRGTGDRGRSRGAVAGQSGGGQGDAGRDGATVRGCPARGAARGGGRRARSDHLDPAARRDGGAAGVVSALKTLGDPSTPLREAVPSLVEGSGRAVLICYDR